MSSFQTLRQLMIEVGPLLEALEISEYAEAKTWSILLEDYLLILESDEKHSLLHISTILETPSEQARQSVYKASLNYTSDSQSDKNCRVGLIEKGSALTLVKSIAVVRFDRNKLYQTLKEFVTEAHKLSKMISTGENKGSILEASGSEMILPV